MIKAIFGKIGGVLILSRRKQVLEDWSKKFNITSDYLVKVEAKQIDIRLVTNRVVYFLEHLGKGLLGIPDPIKRAAAWSTVFTEPPTYEDLVSRTARLRSHIKLISKAKNAKSLTVGSPGLEPGAFAM
ncbi:MAG: hypothetical protein UU73_C0001G0074 [Candidatus Daviesbacteria bacterium GW2011_GWA1_41_61]|uniref:Uncharacterized protein n=1 Tax=Candidatus Daviesbacteria bacterium GW2011_GWA2_40_9 TaxID=1618424 RepID=A0A0G0U6X9_9BACT|nr:MAG: hypothetical protein UU26_C0002G0029 [Candidatus Daviesbacteria bacterium GW2011_GWC1_40_9]KKR82966.1 MAG: hypothetical protein UU29_C0008G0075 [Candidatus Daviesbacteria bacterium GW2011_GWA2_40_9]KKR92893.1 MAG: hypothetical protein UU44_C0004G0075 [Candidatus Daviesbacteria bacterium GW2011_GWB1_41_15]KKS15437.1 MAG: hypothetical protein UU73_C0001G0074 [Candidatus Daviesbacteria bacterium GW2011_GWA1_41_61]